jgi:hypothetical protein
MITAKTSALIAAMSVLGTVAPAAFAQDFVENDIVVGVIGQSNSVGDISQNIEQTQTATATATVQEILDALGL